MNEADRPSKSDLTRTAILWAAVERFGRDGYRSTSVVDVARDVKLSGTATYAYFSSKEELFIAAVDEDAARLIDEGVSSVLGDTAGSAWPDTLILTLLDALPRHPLARRVLAGLEPEFTVRLLHIPALEQLRKAVTEKLSGQQLAGEVRSEVDPASMANGLITIVLSLLMSVVQVGRETAVALGGDVSAVLSAALDPKN